MDMNHHIPLSSISASLPVTSTGTSGAAASGGASGRTGPRTEAEGGAIFTAVGEIDDAPTRAPHNDSADLSSSSSSSSTDGKNNNNKSNSSLTSPNGASAYIHAGGTRSPGTLGAGQAAAAILALSQSRAGCMPASLLAQSREENKFFLQQSVQVLEVDYPHIATTYRYIGDKESHTHKSMIVHIVTHVLFRSLQGWGI